MSTYMPTRAAHGPSHLAIHTQMTQDGIWRGGKCPYGYKLVRKGRTGKKNRELYDLEIDPVAGSQVQLIFEMAGRQGMGKMG